MSFSPNEYEALIGCNQLGKEESGSSLPLSGTLELPSDRPTCAHSAQLAATSCETREIAAEKRERRATPLPPSTAGCVGWVMGKDAYIYKQHRPCFNRELVYARSSTSRWIASRSLKLSDRSCAESYCMRLRTVGLRLCGPQT